MKKMLKEHHKKWVITIGVALADLALLFSAGLILLTIAGLSVMLFDAPGSLENTWTWVWFVVIVVITLGIEIVGIVLAIVNYLKKEYFKSVLFAALPWALIILFYGTIFLFA